MWVDDCGVVHSIAIVDPSRAISDRVKIRLDHESRRSIRRLDLSIRDFGFQLVVGNRRLPTPGETAFVEVALPDSIVIDCSDEVILTDGILSALHEAPPRWQEELAEALRDYIDRRFVAFDPEASPLQQLVSSCRRTTWDLLARHNR